jgi:hypothetical protein
VTLSGEPSSRQAKSTEGRNAPAVEADAVLNLYSGRSNGFSEEDVSTAEAFAAQSAGSLGLVLRVNDRLRYQAISGEQQIDTYFDE